MSLLVVRPFLTRLSAHSILLRAQGEELHVFHSLAAKETSSHQGQTAEGKVLQLIVSFFCAGISRALSCSYGSSPLPLASRVSSARQALRETDSTTGLEEN